MFASLGYVRHGVPDVVVVARDHPRQFTCLKIPSMVVGVGCPNGVLAGSRTGGVRWMVVHATRPEVAMLREDRHEYLWKANDLLFYEGLGAILHTQRTEDLGQGDIHADRSKGIQGGEGVKGRCSAGAA